MRERERELTCGRALQARVPSCFPDALTRRWLLQSPSDRRGGCPRLSSAGPGITDTYGFEVGRFGKAVSLKKKKNSGRPALPFPPALRLPAGRGLVAGRLGSPGPACAGKAV